MICELLGRWRRRRAIMPGRTPEQAAATAGPDPSTSPFKRPGVMTGYPLAPDEQGHVDRVVEDYTIREPPTQTEEA